jgi:hypothetical protein
MPGHQQIEAPQVSCRILVSWKDAVHAEEEGSEGQGGLLKGLSVLVNRYIRPIETLATTSSRAPRLLYGGSPDAVRSVLRQQGTKDLCHLIHSVPGLELD